MTYLKSIRIAGLCLVAMFAVSMAMSATAQAKWEQCSEGETATKYSEHHCTKAEGSGKWQWNEVKGTEEVVIKGTLTLKDTKTAAGESEVMCYGESTGDVGPGQVGRVQEVKVETKNCKAVKVCENVEEVKAVDLPWQTEAYDTEGKKLENITATTNGEPGWSVKCKAPILGSRTDVCKAETGKPESLELVNKNTNGELLVLANFQHLRKAECTEGKKESGEVLGSVAILKTNGWGLRVS